MAQIQSKFLANNAVTNAKLATMSALTIKGNNTGSTGAALDLTVAQVQTMLSIPTSSSPLPLAAGGTGVSAASANAAYNALSPMTTTGDIEYEVSTGVAGRLAIGTTNQVLTVIGGVPSWQTPSSGGITQLTGDVTAGPGSGSQAATLATVNTNVGSFGSSTSIPSLTVNAKGLITAASGNVVIAPAGTLSGTTLNSTVVTSSLTSLGAQASALNMNSNQINNLANGVASTDAANYGQLLAIAAGLTWKNAVLVATTASITLSGEQTIDGFLTSASRVLVKNQGTPSQNGIYVSASGAWARSTDANTWAQLPASVVTVEEGTVNADLGFICNVAPGGTLGTTAISFTTFGTYFADGTTLQLSGGVFSVKNAGITQTQIASSSFSTTGAITGGSGTTIAVSTDGSTVKINGSNQVEALQPNEEQITLSGTNITNQFVDLAHSVFGTSASVNSVGIYVVGGPEQQKTVDYTVSLTGGAGGVTRITFAGGLATGGNSALVASDILVVDYSYLA